MSSTSTVNAPAPGKSLWDGGVSPMGASYGKLMMWFFLLSDAFTFSALLITYGLVRSAHATYEGARDIFTFSTAYWPIPEYVFESVPFMEYFQAMGIDSLPLVFVGIMTFILIMSSVTMVLAVEAGHRMDKAAVEKWMLWTIVGGIIFLSCQAWEWSHFIHGAHHGKAVAEGTTLFGASLTQNQYGPADFAAFFFFITGFHGFHVFSGVCFNFLIYINTVMGVYERRGHYEMVEKVGLYWHFVDLVWVFVFTFFYLV